MKVLTQLLSVNKNREQDATITFGCSLTDLQQIEKFVEQVTVKFWIDGSKEEDKILGNVVNTTTTVAGDARCKFKLKTPATENIKTSQLSTLCGSELEINIELDA